MSQLQSKLVSIITPAFNSAALIGATIESVLTQTYQNWEMIIVTDLGTRDNTAEIVRDFSERDGRIRLVEIKDGRGISLSRNRAITEARGQYLAFLDSDDLWLPDRLKLHLDFIFERNLAFSCAGYRRINLENNRTGRLVLPPKQQTYHDVLLNNLISCPTVIIDQIQTGPLKMKEFAHEDYILWLDILKRGFSCVGFQQDLARYRIVPNSRSMNVNRGGSRWHVYRKFEGLNLFQALFYFVGYAITAILKRIKF